MSPTRVLALCITTYGGVLLTAYDAVHCVAGKPLDQLPELVS